MQYQSATCAVQSSGQQARSRYDKNQTNWFYGLVGFQKALEFCSLAGLVSKPSSLSCILTTTQNVSDQPLSAVKTPSGRDRCGLRFSDRAGRRAFQTGLDERPTAPDPMAITSIHQFIGTACKPAFWCILTSGKPRNQSWHVKVSVTRHRLTSYMNLIMHSKLTLA